MVNFMLYFTTIKSYEKWSKSTGGQLRYTQICKGKQDGWDGEVISEQSPFYTRKWVSQMNSYTGH